MYLQCYQNGMCLAHDTNYYTSLLNSLRCILDLENATLRRAIMEPLASHCIASILSLSHRVCRSSKLERRELTR